MKKFLQLLFLFVIPVNSFSQSLADKMTGILNQISKNIPADQLFLHLDRNLYHTGDTIRFQAYIRDSQTGVFETQSKSLYVLLLNSDHITIDSARFRISYSTASGWLKVPEITPVGYYSILAFTSDQMNYDPRFAFNTPIKIDKINPDRINSDPKESRVEPTVDLRFLPEGGTYIYGVKQRLAFNAVNSDGRNIKASGDIVTQNGKKITEFKSGPYGQGVVEFKPIQGESYYAKPVEEEFGNMSWPLPEPEKSGVSMRVDNTRSGSIDIIIRGNENEVKEYFLTVSMNNILIFSSDVQLDTLFIARIRTVEIPAGTAFVTLYDKELNPITERMIFLNAYKKMNVQIGLSNPTVRPGSETELTINTTDEKGNKIGSIISVSVIDSSSGYQSGISYPEIESAFLYDNEFYNNLPQSIKCLGLRNIDNKLIDNLMMTYGWRKYTLKESALVYQEKRLDNYDHLKISNPGQEKRGRQEINLLSPEGGEAITLRLNENRETVLPFDSLDINARQIMILPDDDPSRNSNPVSIEFPENKEYTGNAKLVRTDSSYSAPDYASIDNEQPVFNPDSAIMIESVTIKGHRKQPTAYVDKNAQNFKYTSAFTLYSKDFEGAQTFEDILYKLTAFYIDKANKLIILRAIPHMPKPNERGGGSGLYRPALIVVDDVPIYTKTYSPIAQMRASEIASVSVLRGPQGFAVYGNNASDGVIFVTTKIGNRINGVIDPNEESKPSDNLLKQVRVFRTEVEYYIPTKEQVEFVPEFQFRPTLLWKSDVYLDGSGSVKFKYPNNLGKGTVMIFVNGVSLTNLIGSNRYIYIVK